MNTPSAGADPPASTAPPATSVASPAQPRRTCIGCGTRDGQGNLVRVVARDGAVVVDARGTLPGRGAYLHRSQACVDQARRRRSFSRALKVAAVVADDLQVGPLEAEAPER